LAQIEGRLKLKNNGRYSIIDNNDKNRTYEITSGEYIKILINGVWVIVRMEHDGEQYYFYGEESCIYPSRRVYARME